MPTDLLLRPATADDLPAIAELYLRVREAAVPAMPPQIHTVDEVRAYVGGWDLARREVWVAELDAALVAFMVVEDAWLDSLYVAPETAGQGVGGALLDVAKGLRPGGFCLWVFESNTPARGFYERRGLVELEHTDGSTNEERSPDLRMAWPGTEPLAFLRGLIDDVDEHLGDLLARRAALTAAVQDIKHDPTRDPAREHAIAEAMAERAPALGVERLTRIVHTIITESLDAAPSEVTRAVGGGCHHRLQRSRSLTSFPMAPSRRDRGPVPMPLPAITQLDRGVARDDGERLPGLLRPPPRPHRVLHARRCRPTRGHGRAHGRAGHAGDRDDRPRQRVRRLRVLQEGEGRRGQADHRHRGLLRPQHLPLRAQGRQLLRRRPRRRLRPRCLHPHDAALGVHRGHAQPLPALAPAPGATASSSTRAWTASCSPSTARASSAPPAARPARSRSTCATAHYDAARQTAADFQDILGRDNYFLELMDHGLDIENRVRDGLLRLAKDLQIPLIATNDSHYVNAGGRAVARSTCSASTPARRWTSRPATARGSGSPSTATATTSSRPRRCARSGPTSTTCARPATTPC